MAIEERDADVSNGVNERHHARIEEEEEDPNRRRKDRAMSETNDAETAREWFDDSFINDHTVMGMEQLQGREFLYTSKKPAVDQRVELFFHAKGSPGYLIKKMKAPSCRLSGQVVEVLPPPAELFPQTEFNDEAYPTSLAYSDLLWAVYKGKLPKGATDFRPCGNCAITDTGHRVFMSRKLWDEQPKSIKKAIDKMIIKTHGALRGQKVVCEGRLNFDFESRRSSEEGPWDDGIPFDGRDIWRFKLVLDDFKQNMWLLDPSSLENLGRDVRPRCWPWSDNSELPYERVPEDHFHVYARPQQMHCTMCIGPFGCESSSRLPHVHHDFLERMLM